jgi:hypothetical protein
MVGALGVLAACTTQTPPPVTPPTQQPTIGASATPAATASPPLEGADFQDDFTASTLDDTKWVGYKQAGLILPQDGRLELLSAGNTATYPYFVTKNAIFPAAGPFFFEINYAYLAGGAPVSFNLDYFPPEAPGQDGLTVPFMRTTPVSSAMRMVFHVESGDPYLDTPLGALSSDAKPHTLRIEFDGTETYRIVFDGAERGTVKSKRRPEKFWVGNYPNRATVAQAWPRIAIDYVKAGVLAPTTP